ncbi:hypothetical protein MGG_17471 [Pyricularia oryzae 70-15]|uniref:F-box domain-containing protein n=1 Tax=Pyricularia oryzae (strain 70-15 / ATCC MYA-4617 / FGSC 8958) TaxID=242507 RepID=G4NCX1_PYRO7|nr:uncharacterized protein MGG_17471 [Pyricularia oryzae 70-15]EHA49161.1 hypothetical protein MGG_17471 [Pyricularia oryzae 70-15]
MASTVIVSRAPAPVELDSDSTGATVPILGARGDEPYYFGLPPPPISSEGSGRGRLARVSMPPSMPGNSAREDAARRGVFMYTYLAHAEPQAADEVVADPRSDVNGGGRSSNSINNGQRTSRRISSRNDAIEATTAAAARLNPPYQSHDRSQVSKDLSTDARRRAEPNVSRPPPPLQSRSVNIPLNGSEVIRPRPAAHQRHFSASASLPSANTDKNDALLLRPPPRSLRPQTELPPTRSSTMAGSAAMIQTGQSGPYPRDQFASGGPYPQAMPYQKQSREEFMMKTDRSYARARTQRQPENYYDQRQQTFPHHYQEHNRPNTQYEHRPNQHHAPPKSPNFAPQTNHHQQGPPSPGRQQNSPYQPHQYRSPHQQPQVQRLPAQRPPGSENQQTQHYSDPPRPVVETRAMTDRFPEGPPRPVAYNFPRRLSSANTASSATAGVSHDSFQSRMRNPSWASQTSTESFHSSLANPPPINRTGHFPRQQMKPGELFAALPGEVLEMILDNLKQQHLEPGSASCATCWMRDVCAVAMSGRKWLKFARNALYEDIQLNGADSAGHKKKYKGVTGTRLVLLRRSLRANPVLAGTVRSLKVPAPSQQQSVEEYHNLIATVIMACPNLERVRGFYPTYNHSFTRFFQAMSSRQRLKEMNWIVQASPFQRQQRVRKAPDDQLGRNLITPGDLQPQQTLAWLDNHANWRYLTNLTIHCIPGATLTPSTLLINTIDRLPSLQTLYLSGLPHNAFGDNELLSLPPLKKLSLFNLPGITSTGLSSFATCWNSRSLRSLSLVHCDIQWIPAMARMFSNLSSLENFAFVQSYPPMLPSDEVIWLFPYLASSSLKKLHWDIPSAKENASAADFIFSRSIQANGFPALRRLRAPADPEGLFQSACRPQERYDLPSDRFKNNKFGGRPALHHKRTGSQGSTASSQNSTESAKSKKGFLSPISPQTPVGSTTSSSEQPLCTDLHQARLAAQARQEAARLAPRFLVNVVDDDGSIADRFGLAGYMGDITSKIKYHLLPDDGTIDEKGGLVDVVDLLVDGGEDLTGNSTLATAKGIANGEGGNQGPATLTKKDKAKEKIEEPSRLKEGCQGRWNYGAVTEKKDKERWSHTERGRWRGVVLS